MQLAGNVINNFLDRQRTRKPAADEYRGADGLIYCAKCGAPRQGYTTFNGQRVIVPDMCLCRLKVEADASEAQRQTYIGKLREACFDSRKMHSYTFNADDEKNAHLSRLMRNYAANWDNVKAKNMGLLIYGSVGTGKTFYAACIANALINRGERVKMTSFTAISNELFGIENKQDYLDKLTNYPLLIIDDFGVERRTDYILEQVETVINMRYEKRKPIIVTTNLSADEIAGTTDIRFRRAFDRMLEVCTLIEMNGESRRQAKAVTNATAAYDLFGKEV